MSILQIKKLETIVMWVIISIMLGVIIALAIFMGARQSFLSILVDTEIITCVISSVSVSAGYLLRRTVKNRRQMYQNAVIILGTLCATSVGAYLSMVIKDKIYYNVLQSNVNVVFVKKLLIPSLIISLIINIASMIIENLIKNKEKLEEQLHLFFAKQKEDKEADGLSVKHDDSYKYIKYADIIYFSSSGRITVIHSLVGDYEIFQLLGKIEEKLLHRGFLRVHKQFIVNASFVSHLKCYTGGRNDLYLNDDDETVIPVGKKYCREFKQYLKI
jgi:hypothetical protein